MGISLQIALALIFLKIPQTRDFFASIASGIGVIKDATIEGTSFVYGYLGGGAVPFEMVNPSNNFVFMFQVLPMILVISAISMLLFYWKILPVIVNGVSFVTRKVLNIGGALGACCAAKIFFGQTEAPLLVRPYLGHFSRNELFSVMTAGMATTSMTLLVVFSSLLEKILPGVATPHILVSSIINIPAALIMAELMVPAQGEMTHGKLVTPYKFSNSMDAVSRGTLDGLQLMLNIGAILVSVLALVFLANKVLSGVSFLVIGKEVTLQTLFGYIFFPVTWLMGIPANEAQTAAELLSTKTVLNEIAAFIGMTKLPQGTLSPNTMIIMIYALCGFANFSSIAIQIGGIGSMIPERKAELIELSPWALVAGTFASCLSGTIVSILLSFQ